MSPDEAAQYEADHQQADASGGDYQGPDRDSEVLGLSQWFRDQHSNDDSDGDEEEFSRGPQLGDWFTPTGSKPKKKKKLNDLGEEVDDDKDEATKPPSDNESETAEDGQSLSQQTTWTQTSFQSQYGIRAAKEWAKQHNEDLANNRRVYGVSEPTAGQKALSGTATAPNRTIGAVAPPYAAPASVVPTQAPSAIKPITTTSPTTGAETPLPNVQVTPSTVPTTLTSPTATPPADTKPKVPPGSYRAPDGTIISDPVNVTDQYGNSWVQSKAELNIRPGGTDGLTITPYVSTENQSSTSSDQYMNTLMRNGGQPDTHEPPSQWVLALPEQGESKPVDYLASLHLRGQGQSVDQTGQESEKILNGISGLVHGDPNSAWAEAYLNDIARLAWVKENANTGKRVDPRNAPEDYIRSWKDAFYGSDDRIPFVKDLDQQMLDRAATSSTPGKFNWQAAFGSTGENGLISRQVASNDCGPNAFSTMLRSRGYNADPADTFKFSKDTGYHDGEQFTGPYRMSQMLREEAGLDAETKPVDWSTIDRELSEGRPVALSSGGHYWVVASRRDGPNGPEYYTGATGAVVGNPEWARPNQIQHGGSPNYMITAKGNVDPNARAIRTMNLRPAGEVYAQSRRENLNMLSDQQKSTTKANSYDDPGTYTPLRNTENIPATDTYKPIINRAAAEHQVDPDLIEAVMYAENESQDPTAESGAGAGGLMQITEPTARGLGITDRFDPVQNIMGGTRYIKQLIDQFGDVEIALAAYNAGPGNVMTYGGIPPFAETKAYVPKVMARYRALKAARYPAQETATPIPVRSRVTR